LRNKGDKYSLYFSVEGNLNEAREKDEVIHFEKSKGEKVKNHLKKVAKEKKVKTTKGLKKDLEELVNLDGALSNSKIPILDPKLHPMKTMEHTTLFLVVIEHTMENQLKNSKKLICQELLVMKKLKIWMVKKLSNI
jgi:hypothetical protein